MKQARENRKNEMQVLFLLGNVFYFILVISAIYFFKERSLYDTGWRIFYMINTEAPCPSHNRWVLVFGQIPAVLAIKFKLSLETVLKLHSVGIVMVFYLMFLFARFVLKDIAAMFAMVLVYLFALGEIYFQWPDLEMLYLSGFFLSLAFLLCSNTKRDPLVLLLFSFPLVFLVINSHPTSLLLLLFLVCYLLIEKKWGNAIVLILLSAILFIKQSVGVDTYEEVKLTSIFLNPDLLLIKGKLLLKYCLFQWVFTNPFLYLFSAIISIHFVKSKLYHQLVLFLSFFFLYSLVIVVYAPLNYHEAYLVPLSGVTLFLFFHHIYRSKNRVLQNFWLVGFLIFVLLFDFASILKAANYQQNKVALYDRLTSYAVNQQNSIYYGAASNLYQLEDSYNNGYPYAESLIISGLKGKEKARGILPIEYLFNNKSNFENYISSTTINNKFKTEIDTSNKESVNQFLIEYFKEDYLPKNSNLMFQGKLNPNYFYFNDSLFNSFNSRILNDSNKIKSNIIVEKSPVYCGANCKYFWVTIKNEMSDPIYSWYGNGIYLKVGNSKFKLEVDVIKEYRQLIKLSYHQTTEVDFQLFLKNTAISNEVIMQYELPK